MSTTSQHQDQIRPDTDPPPWWRRWVGLVVVGLVLVAAGWGVYTLVHAYVCGGPGSGVTEIDGECVGVTDGTYVFDPELAAVEAKIAAENARVTGLGHTVTVAFLQPMTVDDTSTRTLAEVRNELEGAYTAQHRANQPGGLGDAYPLIRLVLANEGSHEDQWQPVVHQLEGMVGGEYPLVAVTGLGSSVTQTELGATELAAHGIPMVGSAASADELSYPNLRGFIRVAASNREHVQSLLAYLQHRPELDSAILVYDSNSEDPASPDLFTRSLREDLNSVMAGLIRFPSQEFRGITNPGDTNPDLFANIVANICAVRPKVVLFAGRQLDVRIFWTALQGRVCPDAPITVVTAAIDLDELRDDEEEMRKKKVTVVYATSTDSSGWANGVLGTPAHFADSQSELAALGFDVAHLDSGAVGTHDALLAAVKAIRLAVLSTPSSQNKVPTPADVLVQLRNLNGLHILPGAGGDLSFSFRGDESGNPCGKPVPVLEIPSSGSGTEPPYVTCR